MIATYKVQLIPTKEQENKFIQFSGTSRFVYNHILTFSTEYYEVNYESPTLQDCIEEIQRLKYGEHDLDRDYSWLLEIPESVTKQAIKDLRRAFVRFYNGQSRFPKYKSKKNMKLSFYQRTDRLRIEGDTITITGVGKVRYGTNRYGVLDELEGFKNPRVSFDGKYWYITFGIEFEPETYDEYSEPIGIDLGLKTLAVVSNGKRYENIERINKNYKKEEIRLKKLQRKFSRQYEQLKKDKREYRDAKNIHKTKAKITLSHRRLRHMRETYLHTITMEIVKDKPSRIVVEDLNVKGMMKNKHIARSLAKQSFYMFYKFLEYKCDFWGIELVRADRFFPSSKLCSCCGSKKKKLSLSERVYICDNCNNTMDRDLNAAINLSKYTA